MGVYIKSVKMPMNCDDCHLDIDCPYDESQDGYKMIGGRPRKCPLVPAPPHGSLIEKHDVFKLITAFPEVDKFLPVEFMKALYNLPTVIPASKEGE